VAVFHARATYIARFYIRSSGDYADGVEGRHASLFDVHENMVAFAARGIGRNLVDLEVFRNRTKNAAGTRNTG
jgi:hypothetical protein